MVSFDSRDGPHEIVDAPVELSPFEWSLVSGGVMCSRNPAVQIVMYMATAGVNTGTQNGPFVCWG